MLFSRKAAASVGLRAGPLGSYSCAAVLMGSKPCLAGAYLGRQGDAVMHNVFHFLFQDALYLIALCLGRLDDQLIVDLQKQAGLQLFSRRRCQTWTIASLMMSAAVPWIGVLRAIRSPLART